MKKKTKKVSVVLEWPVYLSLIARAKADGRSLSSFLRIIIAR